MVNRSDKFQLQVLRGQFPPVKFIPSRNHGNFAAMADFCTIANLECRKLAAALPKICKCSLVNGDTVVMLIWSIIIFAEVEEHQPRRLMIFSIFCNLWLTGRGRPRDFNIACSAHANHIMQRSEWRLSRRLVMGN